MCCQFFLGRRYSIECIHKIIVIVLVLGDGRRRLLVLPVRVVVFSYRVEQPEMQWGRSFKLGSAERAPWGTQLGMALTAVGFRTRGARDKIDFGFITNRAFGCWWCYGWICYDGRTDEYPVEHMAHEGMVLDRIQVTIGSRTPISTNTGIHRGCMLFLVKADGYNFNFMNVSLDEVRKPLALMERQPQLRYWWVLRV